MSSLQTLPPQRAPPFVEILRLVRVCFTTPSTQLSDVMWSPCNRIMRSIIKPVWSNDEALLSTIKNCTISCNSIDKTVALHSGPFKSGYKICIIIWRVQISTFVLPTLAQVFNLAQHHELLTFTRNLQHMPVSSQRCLLPRPDFHLCLRLGLPSYRMGMPHV